MSPKKKLYFLGKKHHIDFTTFLSTKINKKVSSSYVARNKAAERRNKVNREVHNKDIGRSFFRAIFVRPVVPDAIALRGGMFLFI